MDKTLEGKLLVAMPGLEDESFSHSVIYICMHNEDGTMGVVVNKPSRHIRLEDLFEGVPLLSNMEPSYMPILVGGPCDRNRGFVLHSRDYCPSNSEIDTSGPFQLTATMDILQAIAQGKGPEHALLALGYAGWGSGQLEKELSHNSWFISDADAGLVFSKEQESIYPTALRRIGVDIGRFSTQAGEA